MKTIVKFGLAAATGVLLSGCSLFNGGHQARLGSNLEAELATAETVADIQLEVGRENLANGNLATAARYLREARAHPNTRAAATNALGVVYIRLGRIDVAQRYFAEAVDLEPDNARFLTNLARIERDISFARLRADDARGHDGAETLFAVAPVEPVAAPNEQSEEVRSSANVIHIRTAEIGDHAPARMQVVSRTPVVQMTRNEAAPEAEPAQDEPEEAPNTGTQAKVVDYPVRIAI